MRKKDPAQTCHPQEGQWAPTLLVYGQHNRTWRPRCWSFSLESSICPRDERFLRHLKKRSPLEKRNNLKMTEYQAGSGKYRTLRIDHANLWTRISSTQAQGAGDGITRKCRLWRQTCPSFLAKQLCHRMEGVTVLALHCPQPKSRCGLLEGSWLIEATHPSFNTPQVVLTTQRLGFSDKMLEFT